MIWLGLSYILVALASTCNAVIDKLSHHYDRSIFKDFKNRYWWDPTMSWENKYVLGKPEYGRVKWNILGFRVIKPVQFTDAWHFFKMLMIVFMCAAISCGIFYHHENLTWWWFVIYLGSLGTLWNITFSAFYDKILKKK
jgi:hypothetical protein